MVKQLSLILDRRRALQWLGVGLGAAPLARVLAGCEDGAKASARDAIAPDGNDAIAPDTNDTTTGDSAEVTTASDADVTPSTGWATGGTQAMTDKASYPDPFAALGTSCALYCQATLGPCHAVSPEREDVSDGWDGIPVRLVLRVVDEACAPLEDAIVEIWHTNNAGIYSGDINTMCNETEEQRAAGFFRGYRRSDSDGRVAFDTVYPGWYAGRAIHIHFRIMTGVYDGSDRAASTLVSQLFFSDELNAAVFSDEPIYADYGQPDTSNVDDNVVGGEADLTPYVLDVQKMSDGAMLASKTIIVRSASAANCALEGA